MNYELAFLFFSYSFLGWIAETVTATAKGKSFVNRGFASGPFCFVYGLAGAILAVTMRDVVGQPVYLFLGCVVIATGIEWSVAKLLEHLHQRRWWDYSGKRWNFDGYICLQYSLLWGVLGTFSVLVGNGLLTRLFHLIPAPLGKFRMWFLFGYGILDGVVSLLTVFHLEERAEGLFRWSARLRRLTIRFGGWLSRHVEGRMTRAYPAMEEKKEAAAAEKERLGVSKLFWLFCLCSFLGDITETLYCRLRAGIWMSRSSLVWGPFSVVWGLALVLATALLYRDRNKPDRSIFAAGFLAGGAYEYICSVLSELVFGTVFWDYSEIPFNLNGRINLLFCFFWGVAAVIWIKLLYPRFSRLLDRIVHWGGKPLTLALAVFMAANIVLSIGALSRYSERAAGVPAQSGWEQMIDQRFDDERMARIYPNAIMVDK